MTQTNKEEMIKREFVAKFAMDSDSPLHNVVGTDLATICDFFLERTISKTALLAWVEGKKIIPVEVPHHNPHLTGYNSALTDIQSAITKGEIN